MRVDTATGHVITVKTSFEPLALALIGDSDNGTLIVACGSYLYTYYDQGSIDLYSASTLSMLNTLSTRSVRAVAVHENGKVACGVADDVS